MSDASLGLRAAIHDALIADAGLNAVLGANKIFDVPQRQAMFPYVTLGEMRLQNISADDAPLYEHLLTLHVWSREGGHKQAHLITGVLLSALDDAALVITGHRLVNLRFTLADIRREADGRTYHAVVRFRAVTEPSL